MDASQGFRAADIVQDLLENKSPCLQFSLHGPCVDALAGGIRNQFHHFIDIVPTLLEAAGVPAPRFAYGIEQRLMDDICMD